MHNSNSGKEFVLAFMSNYKEAPTLVLFLTSSKALTYKVEVPGQGEMMTGALQANELKAVQLPHTIALTSGIEEKGILVTSSEDMTVYGLNQILYSTDAFLALPTSVQGHEYVISSYIILQPWDYSSILAIVAIRDDTTLTIQLSSTASDGKNNYDQGEKASYTLNRLQTLQLTGTDLTGTLIYSDKPVSVFGGHVCATVPLGSFDCDHLAEQIPPVTTLGTTFATSPLALRTSGDVFRLVAARDGTSVKVNGIVETTLSSGQFYEMNVSSTTFASIETDEPILLVQFSKGSTVDGVTSDPFMAIIPSIEQYRHRYIISTPAASPVAFTNYVNLIIENDETSGLRLDDQPLPSDTTWHSIPETSLVGTSILVSIESHRLHHIRRAKFGLIAYGYASWDAYGYPGGLQLYGECIVETTVTQGYK